MNARQYVAWATAQLSGPVTAAQALFLSLPGRWSRALGPLRAEHFLESSASSAGGDSLKLALILRASPQALRGRAWRDDDGKARAGARLIEALNAGGSRYDAQAYARACGLLARWRLRGSLMISCDFDGARSLFAKTTFYGFAPDDEAVAELASALAGRPGAAVAADGGSLEFWGLDLWPEGRSQLKLYRRRPYRRDALPAAHQALAAALETVGEVRDLTTLTRVAAGRPGERKLYLGFGAGVDAARLRRLPAAAATARFLAGLAERAAGQRVYFVGFSDDGTLEAYFDRREPDHEEQGPLDDDL